MKIVDTRSYSKNSYKNLVQNGMFIHFQTFYFVLLFSMSKFRTILEKNG